METDTRERAAGLRYIRPANLLQLNVTGEGQAEAASKLASWPAGWLTAGMGGRN